MRLLIFASVCIIPAVSFGQDPQEHLPPVQAWHGKSEALVAPVGHPWITPAEQSQFMDSPGYDNTIAWLKRLCAATPLISMVEFGRTAQGRPLYLVIASGEKQHTPEALRAGGKPSLLAQAGIHSGEIDGKDAGLMLLRDIAFGGRSALLDHANLLFIPVLNADGHERASPWNRANQRGPARMGWRTTAQNLNLNRDYVKADAPETRALLSLLDAWQPSLYLDIHVTDGLDYQYDITFTHHGRDGGLAWSPKIGTWLDTVLNPAVTSMLKAQGHLPLNFYINPHDKRDFKKGLETNHAAPRFSHGYGDLRHLPSVLIETHSLKTYRQRVLGTHVLLTATMQTLGRDGAALQAAIAADQAERQPEVILTWAKGGLRREVDFLGVDSETWLSPVSGVEEIRWLGRAKTYEKLPVFSDKPGVRVKRPVAYWVPVTKVEVIERLEAHGIHFETLKEPRTLDVEMYRLIEPQGLTEAQPFESRHLLNSPEVKSERHHESFPAGSVRVPTDQPLGDLAVMMLEPQGADSLYAWGFFNEILQRTEYIEGYVIAPLAEQMLKDDARLKAEFEAKLATDKAFAADPKARLQWFYTRTKFADERFLLYPVGIER